MKKQAEVVLFVDGGSRGNPGPAAAGVVLHDQQGRKLLEAGYFLGSMTNNQAEYRALILGIQAAARCAARRLAIRSDSELLVRQIQGTYRVKSPALKPLFGEVQNLLAEFEHHDIRHLPREHNQRADELANLAMDAGEDVVQIERLGTLGGEASGAASQGIAPQVTPVVVEVDTKPPGEPCAEGCSRGRRYVVADTLPLPLGLAAAAKIIAAVNRLRGPAGARSNSPKAQIVETCPRCGAVFRISTASSPDSR